MNDQLIKSFCELVPTVLRRQSRTSVSRFAGQYSRALQAGGITVSARELREGFFNQQTNQAKD